MVRLSLLRSCWSSTSVGLNPMTLMVQPSSPVVMKLSLFLSHSMNACLSSANCSLFRRCFSSSMMETGTGFGFKRYSGIMEYSNYLINIYHSIYITSFYPYILQGLHLMISMNEQYRNLSNILLFMFCNRFLPPSLD